jgi:UDP-N-acetyl-D-mannosaminuronic acid dehydrogenase
MTSKTVCVVGLGYIGLPTAALLANTGFRVFGCDKDPEVVATINDGRIHIVEPDLDHSVRTAVEAGMLTASAEPQSADVFMICVPTPLRRVAEGPAPDVSYVMTAARAIAPHLKSGSLVILESTSPVGTTKAVADELERCGVDLSTVGVAYCPERVLPGRMLIELVENDRIVGGLTPEATSLSATFYRSFVEGEVLATDAATAEMCKLTENSFRDVNIAFANELSMLCEDAGINVWEVIALSNRHPRVAILQPGAGVGGHCIAVDPWFIVASNPGQAKLIRTAREVNDRKADWVVESIVEAANGARLRKRSEPLIACLGLSFKPNIDDLRESPALAVFRRLRKLGLRTWAVEPNVQELEDAELKPLEQALEEADLVCVLVNHRQFLAIEPNLREEQLLLNFCSPSRLTPN